MKMEKLNKEKANKNWTSQRTNTNIIKLKLVKDKHNIVLKLIEYKKEEVEEEE